MAGRSRLKKQCFFSLRDRREPFADQIETRVQDATARVNHLTQSILAKALTRTSLCSGLRPSLRLSKIAPGNFVSGELTADWRAQNPELVSGENSAEALLARIQAERETTGTKKKGHNSTRTTGKQR